MKISKLNNFSIIETNYLKDNSKVTCVQENTMLFFKDRLFKHPKYGCYTVSQLIEKEECYKRHALKPKPVVYTDPLAMNMSRELFLRNERHTQEHGVPCFTTI